MVGHLCPACKVVAMAWKIFQGLDSVIIRNTITAPSHIHLNQSFKLTNVSQISRMGSLLRAVKDWVLCILNTKIEYFVCRFLGHVVLVLLLDVIYENILPLTSI